MGRPKQWLSVGGRPLLAWTLADFQDCPRVGQVVVVVPPEDIELAR